MTASQKTSISSPTAGLLIYQTDGTAGFYYYTSDAWIRISSELLSKTEGANFTGSLLAGHLHRRGEDSRLEGAWVVEEKVVDQLSDDEIAQQWEYNVEDPKTPRLIEPQSSDLQASEDK